MVGPLLTLALETGVSDHRVWAYVAFLALVLVFLALDLGVFHRQAHVVSFREAAKWSVVWVTCGVLFAVVVYLGYERHWLGLGLDTPVYAVAAAGGGIERGTVNGFEAAEQYLTGYIVEKSLAMDNIFVIALIFSFFAVPAKYQHRVLFWGILGALAMRGTMIFLGAEIIARHTWVLILFGALLIATAVKMIFIQSDIDPSRNPVVRLAKRVLPSVDWYDGQRFLTRDRGRLVITPLFLALVMVEITDLIFAVDSIPAVFAVTPDPFIVLTSNVFAMLGLRSLYFCLASILPRFRYLKVALILILLFVGVKLLLLAVPPYLQTAGGWIGLEIAALSPVKVSTGLSLGVIGAILAAAVAGSVLHRRPAGGEADTSTSAEGASLPSRSDPAPSPANTDT